VQQQQPQQQQQPVVPQQQSQPQHQQQQQQQPPQQMPLQMPGDMMQGLMPGGPGMPPNFYYYNHYYGMPNMMGGAPGDYGMQGMPGLYPPPQQSYPSYPGAAAHHQPGFGMDQHQHVQPMAGQQPPFMQGMDHTGMMGMAPAPSYLNQTPSGPAGAQGSVAPPPGHYAPYGAVAPGMGMPPQHNSPYHQPGMMLPPHMSMGMPMGMPPTGAPMGGVPGMGDSSDLGLQYSSPAFQGSDMGAFDRSGANKPQGARDDFYGRPGAAGPAKVNQGNPNKGANGAASNGAPRFEDNSNPYAYPPYNSMLLQQPGAPFGFSAPSTVGSKPQGGQQTVRRP
jgi:hypothetical protein